MRAVIKNIIDSEVSLIEVETDFGFFRGCSQGFDPVIEKQYYIELTLDEVLGEGDATIEPVCDRNYSVCSKAGYTHFQCQLIDSESDGVLTFRIGTSIFLASCENRLLVLNGFYSLKVDENKVLIYDTNLV